MTPENQESIRLCDQIVRPSHFCDDHSDDCFEAVPHTRPDLCLIDRDQKQCLIVEVAVPYDPFVNECYQGKFDKYMPLCQRISDLGYHCKIVVLIVGSLGSVHKKFVSGLCMAGLSPRRARAIAKYCSISAAIGSKIIWKLRCKNT